MSLRRKTLNASLKQYYKIHNKDKSKRLIGLSITAFPLLGVGNFTIPKMKTMGKTALSKYVPDECINKHPRFATLTANIRKRRGKKGPS